MCFPFIHLDISIFPATTNMLSTTESQLGDTVSITNYIKTTCLGQ